MQRLGVLLLYVVVALVGLEHASSQVSSGKNGCSSKDHVCALEFECEVPKPLKAGLRACEYRGELTGVCCPGKYAKGVDRPECGIVEVDVKPSAGELVAEPGRWPWMVFIGTPKSSSATSERDWLCSGTLLSGQHVLTPLSCVQRRPVGSLVVLAGARRLFEEATARWYQETSVSRILQPPHDRSHGLALLVTPAPFNINRHVRPVCMPQLNGLQLTGASVYNSGWALIVNRRKAKVPLPLSHVQHVVQNDSLCSEVLQESAIDSGLAALASCSVVSDDEAPSDTSCLTDSGGLFRKMVNSSAAVYQLVGVPLLHQHQPCPLRDGKPVSYFISVTRPSVYHWINRIVLK